MKIRTAKTSDAPIICEMINHWAEQGKMLHRSLESVYDSLREFQVAEDNGKIVGCVAVDIFWGDLAEVKSLAVAAGDLGKGAGSKLLTAAIADAKTLGVKRLFALTYENDFFARHGFEMTDRQLLPEKVWRECLSCAKADACDEICMQLEFDGRG